MYTKNYIVFLPIELNITKMKDIHDIKILLNINIFDIWIFVISLFLALITYFWLIFISKIMRNKAKNYEKIKWVNDLKNNYFDKIAGISVDNDNFFYELNLLVREFLEKFEIINNSTKMTWSEISTKFKENKNISSFFIDCDKYEFSREITDKKQKENMKNLALNIVKQL